MKTESYKTNLNKSYIRKTLIKPKFDLKVSTLGEVTTSWGKEFQSFIIHCRNVCVITISLKSLCMIEQNSWMAVSLYMLL